MARFLCSSCQEVVEAAAMRFAFCSACGGPLTIEDMVPVQLIRSGADAPEEEAVAEPAGP